jgi:hypothetical protein
VSILKVSPLQMMPLLDELGYQSGPTGLVACADPGTVVTVEIFAEQDVVFPLRIGLKFLRTSVYRPPTRPISQKDPG